ncbi:MAG: DUF692 domain-containing protein [Elusimicrobia bacterium]|nr:DUF692 domain-containing protein [Elusimicrobiota bacterium]
MAAELSGSAGLAFHACLEDDVLISRRDLGHVAIMADHFMNRRETWPSLARLKSFLPVVAHGVGLSLGSADGLDPAYAGPLVEFLDFLRPAWFGEHLAFTRAGGRDLGHLGPLPFNAESVRAVARNAASIKAELPCPLLLENISTPFLLPGSVWSEPEFVARALDAADCGLLLDLHNLHADAHNQGFDAEAALDAMPIERAVEVHVAGGFREGRWLVDSHTKPPPDAVFDLLARVRGRGVDPAVTLEWDRNLPPFEALLEVLERARGVAGVESNPLRVGPFEPRPGGPALGPLQERFVEAVLAPAGRLEGVDDEAIAHYAGGLKRKKGL